MTDEPHDPMPAVTRHVERLIARHVKENHPPSPIPAWLYPPRNPLEETDQVLTPSAEELRTLATALDACEGYPLMTRIVQRDGSPWLELSIACGPEQPPTTLDEAERLAILSRPDGYRVERFALWRYTLRLYRIGPDGAVEDDPIDQSPRTA